jgi:hypothetical protein
MRVKVVGFLVALLAVWPVPAGAGRAPFTIDPFSVERYPGETFTVTGSGCPPTGAFPSSSPLVLLLTPATGGNSWGPGIIKGAAGPFMTGVYYAGEVAVEVVSNPDGSFTADITVPQDAPASDGYTVRGMCLTLLEPRADDPNDFTVESAAASMTEAGALHVLGSADTTTTTNPASVRDPAPSAAPRFTG